jgi:hypothetical protein
MAAAKQQYQAAMAAAAIQAADEAWERASNMGGTSGSQAFSVADGPASNLFPFPSHFGGDNVQPRGSSSVYGGSTYAAETRPGRSHPGYGRSASSVYGGSFGPPSQTRFKGSDARSEYSPRERANSTASRTRFSIHDRTARDARVDASEAIKTRQGDTSPSAMPPSSWKGSATSR